MQKIRIADDVFLVQDAPGYLENSATGKKVKLDPADHKILNLFVMNPGRKFTTTMLIIEIKGRQYFETKREKDPEYDGKSFAGPRVCNLRKKLDEVLPGLGDRYIKTIRGIERIYVSNPAKQESSIQENIVTTYDEFIFKSDMANAFEALDKMMREIEDIQAKIDSNTTAFQLKKYYSQHLNVLLFRYDQLHKEVSEKYLEVENLRNNYRQNETVSGTSAHSVQHECEIAVFKQHLEDLGAWVSGAVSAMDLLSYELDEAIRAFINDNIDDLSAVFDALPENKQTTHVLLDCVDTFDSCAELYETLFERKSYLEPEELEKLINRAKKNFDPQQWSLWDMED